METVDIAKTKINGEIYYKISNYNLMRPFFMSIVSDSNHWMFISSSGGLSAGRKDASQALFPYYTDDKITESYETTGSKTIIQISKSGIKQNWEPFSNRNLKLFRTTRNLYKNRYGNKIRFEEINHDLEISFVYEWCSSKKYGFVKKSEVKNLSNNKIKVNIIDGIQNVLPYGVPSDLQNNASNLVNAYKRNQLHAETGLGIYALSAIIVDKAEPSEALKANVVWSTGIKNPTYLLSSLQLNKFRERSSIVQEDDIKGETGAYLINSTIELDSQSSQSWLLVANVNQSQSKVSEVINLISTTDNLRKSINEDIEIGTRRLITINASADGLQSTADHMRDARHFSNVLFNNMRGGIFDNNYQIELEDFEKYIQNANKKVHKSHSKLLRSLPEVFSLSKLRELIKNSNDIHFARLSIEYLPLKFSRRHGDPSRPWNQFSINLINEEDGSKILDYEGNWRDIFQNWEALVHSFPEFIEAMIFKFLNASTFDGYNPYRVNKDGFDWEIIEPDDPWSYIGYWGDHQIIYLLKFLEFIEDHYPGKLAQYFDEEIFVYANVPYRIKSYNDILSNPKDTIEFDELADEKIRDDRDAMGADGALLKDENGNIYNVNLVEKLLATLLAKVSNFVPDGGIWMNTQRPEWNDANNALVGNGISMVTLYYLRRFVKFFLELTNTSDLENLSLSSELMDFYKRTRRIFEDYEEVLKTPVSDKNRKDILDELGNAASEYRMHIYDKSFWGKKRSISVNGLQGFLNNLLNIIDVSIEANKRSDEMYHAYNLLNIDSDNVSISRLEEMLEGQVAVLSSGYLDSESALKVLDALKASALFRDDQYSYLLYPNKSLKGFLEKNIIPQSELNRSESLQQLLKSGNTKIVEKDVFGKVHFNGNFRNADDLKVKLKELDIEDTEAQVILEVFESVFNHKAFTGRSGTFYGYEGLGSIYWHMVSKLLLAVMECSLKAINENADPSTIGRLLEHFYEIQEGIGVHKPPQLYGAFPTDPYSHTPFQKGAQQPGMTGQVKEDVLSRFGELGVFVEDGQLKFYPCLLRKAEFLKESRMFHYLDVKDNHLQMELQSNSMAFTYCQVPIIYHLSSANKLSLTFADGGNRVQNDFSLSLENSQAVFSRTDSIKRIDVHIEESILK